VENALNSTHSKLSCQYCTVSNISGVIYSTGVFTSVEKQLLTFSVASGFLDQKSILADPDLTLGTRILVKDQTDKKQNGIYRVSSLGSSTTSWTLTRDFDSDTGSKLSSGSFTNVIFGSRYKGSCWILTTPGPIVFDNSLIAFESTVSNSQVDLVGTQDRVTVSDGQIDIASSYVGQSSITVTGSLNHGSVSGSTTSTFKLNSLSLGLENLDGLANVGLTIPYHMGNTANNENPVLVVPKPSLLEVGRLHYFINMDTTGGASAGFMNKFVTFDFLSGGSKILNALGVLNDGMKLRPGNAICLIYLGEPAELNGLGLWGLTNSGATMF
jgi:hypothetical protein